MTIQKLTLEPVPTAANRSVVFEGSFALDESYFYIYSYGTWRRAAISNILTMDELPHEINNLDRDGLKNGMACYSNYYLFIYYNGWKNIAISSINPLLRRQATFSRKVFLNQMKIANGRITQIRYGIDGEVGFDRSYFYIMVGKTWKKFAISKFL